MAYQRKIIHLDTDATTQIQVLSSVITSNSRVEDAWFELLRKGGCGAGEITLKDAFTLRDQIEVGQYIAFEYTAGERWYLGRVEEIEHTSPSGATVQLYGMGVELSEVFPGGFGQPNDDQPRRYARSDWFLNDPDYGLHVWDTVSQPNEVVTKMFNSYIAPATNISLGTVEFPNPLTGLDSWTFRGQESAMSIMRTLGLFANDASWGVDADGELFFIRKRTGVLDTFREGTDVEDLKRRVDRSQMYNYILMTGDYVYGASTQSGFYRYQSRWKQFSSAAIHGERRIRMWIPWIRRNADAYEFARQFFALHAYPTKRETFRTEPQSALLKPWDGHLKLLAADGSLLSQQMFDRVRVDFNHAPVFTITTGPEDVQFPDSPEEQRWELQATDAGDGEPPPNPSVSSTPTFTTGTVSASSSGSSGSSGSVTSIAPSSFASSSGTPVSSAGGGGGGTTTACGVCNPAPAEFDVDISLPTNGTCLHCDSISSVFTVPHAGSCTWETSDIGGQVCDPPPVETTRCTVSFFNSSGSLWVQVTIGRVSNGNTLVIWQKLVGSCTSVINLSASDIIFEDPNFCHDWGTCTLTPV
jgi:hypothetical protein